MLFMQLKSSHNYISRSYKVLSSRGGKVTLCKSSCITCPSTDKNSDFEFLTIDLDKLCILGI